jgi:hypothetical protein
MMSTSTLKMLACRLSLICGLLLIGCDKNTQQAPPVSTTTATEISTPSKPSAAAPAAVPAEAFEKLGLFSGVFEPNDELKKVQASYEKWSENLPMEEPSELSEIPAQFRAYVRKDLLHGGYGFITPNRLSIFIDAMRDDNSFLARSVSAGNLRLINGRWKQVGDNFQFSGSEPGDDANDGRFEMTLTKEGLSGSWTPLAGKSAPKTFTLTSAEFKYDPELGQNEKKGYPIDLGDSNFVKNPSVDKLTSNDVENLTQPHIRIIRNLIFARHGYSFKGKDMRLMFEPYDWYTPVSNDIKAELTQLEKANITLLNRYEKYADKHYDEWGR